jgi:hypothetical protein
VVDDPHDRQIAGIRLASCGLACRRTAHADHPVARDGTHRVDGNFLGAAIKHHLQVFVLEISDAVGGNQRFENFADQHLSELPRC